MKRKIKVWISGQAKLMLREMPSVNEEDFLEWFCGRGVSAGGGNLIDYLRHLEEDNG